MTDYQPTDEQIEALAKSEFETATCCEWLAARDVEQDDFRNWARQSSATPAFQAITRAAQADALRTWADELETSLIGDEDASAFLARSVNRLMNPTTRLIVRKTREQANRIEAADE